MSGLPELRTRHRLEERSRQVEDDRLVERERQRRHDRVIGEPPDLAAALSRCFLDREPHVLQFLKVAADRPVTHAELRPISLITIPLRREPSMRSIRHWRMTVGSSIIVAPPRYIRPSCVSFEHRSSVVDRRPEPATPRSTAIRSRSRVGPVMDHLNREDGPFLSNVTSVQAKVVSGKWTA